MVHPSICVQEVRLAFDTDIDETRGSLRIADRRKEVVCLEILRFRQHLVYLRCPFVSKECLDFVLSRVVRLFGARNLPPRAPCKSGHSLSAWFSDH